jgi:2-keto-4-pentenoate hydratase/2-oxohepta-3-ene-1,7-dioic acid hydratase in catechol pathway
VKLVTYDRRGHRRLGALMGEEVADLPDLVGHPAFPTTMEALIARNGGTVLDAAQTVLDRGGWEDFVVSRARLLAPILPSSLRSFEAFVRRSGGGSSRFPRYALGNHRAVLGPGDEVLWPSFTRELDYELEVAAVIGRAGRDLDPDGARKTIFGYTLMNDWTARDAEREDLAGGLGPARSKGFATSLGPCVVTADELEPRRLALAVRVDGETWGEGTLLTARWTFPEMIAHASLGQDVLPGDVFGSGPFHGGTGRDLGRTVPAGAVVELEADGIGILRNPVSRPNHDSHLL